MSDHPTAAPSVSADEEERAFEASLAAMQRRRRLTFLIVTVGLGALVAGAAVWLALQPAPRCDSDDVAFFLAERHLPAAAVARVCRFDSPLAEALDGAEAAPPGMGHLLILQAISEHPQLITRVCGGAAIAGLAEAMEAAPQAQAGRFLATCPLSGDAAFAGQETLERASLGRLVTAIAVFGALRASDSRHAAPLARRFLTGP